MENHNQIQEMVSDGLEAGTAALLCPPPCNGAICISRTRYDELIRAEMEREILFHAYQIMSRYDMEHVMDAIFNPDFKQRDKSSADHKAGADDAE